MSHKFTNVTVLVYIAEVSHSCTVTPVHHCQCKIS